MGVCLVLVCASNLFVLTAAVGFHDVGYKDAEIISPHIDDLRAQGVELSSFFSAKWCAPARSSMQTGRYPWRNGYYTVPSSEAVPLATPLLAEILHDSGYRTHAVGKWHLGFKLKEFTPTFRGFDSFVGFYNSMEDYWTHWGPSAQGRCSGVDLSNSSGANDPAGISAASPDMNGTYSSMIYSRRAAEIFAAHTAEHADSPLYLYLPFQSVHMPAEAPASMIQMQAPIKNAARRTYLGMISAVDAAIGNTVAAMKTTGLWGQSVLLLNGDNGGPVWCSGMYDCPDAKPDMYGPVSNYPLRSGKWTNWDGGFRVNAFISSPLLPPGRRNTTWAGHMHVADIFKTFGGLARLSHATTFQYAVDSYDMWDAILSDGPSPRNEIAHLITNQWNVVNGIGQPCNACMEGQDPGTYPFCVNVSATKPFRFEGKQQTGCGGALQVGHLKLLVGFPGDPTLYGPPEQSAGMSGHDQQANLNSLPAYPCQKYCLFNVTDDPSETKDLSADPALDDQLQALLRRYEQLSTQGADVYDYRQMLNETGAVCVSGLNDSCAVAIRTGCVEPCGFTVKM